MNEQMAGAENGWHYYPAADESKVSWNKDWPEEWMDGWMDLWMDGWTNGRKKVWVEK